MSQFGMNMPSVARNRGASIDIYAALMGMAVIALIAAILAMVIAGKKVGLNGSPFSLQSAEPNKIELPKQP